MLERTTVEELEQYHLKTMKLCIERANEAEVKRLEQERLRRERDKAARREHESHVGEVVDRLRFDDEEA